MWQQLEAALRVAVTLGARLHCYISAILKMCVCPSFLFFVPYFICSHFYAFSLIGSAVTACAIYLLSFNSTLEWFKLVHTAQCRVILSGL